MFVLISASSQQKETEEIFPGVSKEDTTGCLNIRFSKATNKKAPANLPGLL